MKKDFKFFIRLFLAFGTIFFVVVNYLYSDYQYFRNEIKRNSINTSEEVYQYVINNSASTLEKKSEPCQYCSPKFLLKKGIALSCDEGAIIIAHMSYLLGYKTRLVDLIGTEDGVSHHTIVEVFEGNRWKRYDYWLQNIDAEYTTGLNYEPYPRYRKYPRWYNKIIYNFYFITYIIVRVRGAQG